MRLALKPCMTAAVLLASVPVAKAQTAGAYLLTHTAPISVQGWSFTLGVCEPSAASSICAVSEVLPTVVAQTLSLVFESNTGGTLFPAGAAQDFSFGGIAVTAPTGARIYETSVMIAGTGTPVQVTGGETVTNKGTIETGLTVNLATPAAMQAWTANRTVSAATDFGVGNTLSTMTTAKLTFTTAPEPVSISLLGVGIAGLAAVRRKARRRANAAQVEIVSV